MMTWVEGATGWGWLLFVLLCIGIGVVIGYWFRGAMDRERQAEVRELENAQRAAQVYWREIERARRRHPSHGR